MKFSDGNMLLGFEDGVLYDNKIWFTEINGNMLFYYDLAKRKAFLVCHIDEESEYGFRLFSKIIEYRGILYLIPLNTVNFYAYDIGRQKLLHIDLDGIDIAALNRGKASSCLDAHLYNGRIYMPLLYSFQMIEYDCGTGRAEYYDISCCGKVDEYISRPDGDVYRKSMLLGSKIYMPLRNGNAVVVFNLVNRQSEVYEVGNMNFTYTGICFDGEYFWLAPEHARGMVRWDGQSGNATFYELDGDVYPEVCADIVYFHGCIFPLPMTPGDIWSIDAKTMVPRKLGLSISPVGHISCFRNDFCQYFFSISEHRLFVLDLACGKVDEFSIAAPRDLADYCRKCLIISKLSASNVLSENMDFALQEFINCLIAYELTDENERV